MTRTGTATKTASETSKTKDGRAAPMKASELQALSAGVSWGWIW